MRSNQNPYRKPQIIKNIDFLFNAPLELVHDLNTDCPIPTYG